MSDAPIAVVAGLLAPMSTKTSWLSYRELAVRLVPMLNGWALYPISSYCPLTSILRWQLAYQPTGRERMTRRL